MSQTLILTIDPEIEAIASETQTTVDVVVHEAIATYLRVRAKLKLRQRLAQEYQALAAMWHELADDLDERWLVVENEALSQPRLSFGPPNL